MRIAVTGATGLIGGALVPALLADGHEVVVVSRRTEEAVRERLGEAEADSGSTGEDAGGPGRPRRERDAGRGAPTTPGAIDAVARWDPDAGVIDAGSLAGIDAAVHLAGEGIFGLWTARKKERIRRSRIEGTRFFAETLTRLDRPPATLVSASGINYYGDRPADEALDETSPPGHGFLADLVRDWEASTQPAEAAGVRVVHTRFGLVLTPRGGPLLVMLPLFRIGLGGKIGRGDGVWSWVALDDVVGAIRYALGASTRASASGSAGLGPAEGERSPTERAGSRVPRAGTDSPDTTGAAAPSDGGRGGSLAGPVNVVSPNPVTQAAFVRTLARVLGRPAPFRVPAFAARAVLREQADEMLLFGARVLPRRLEETGYEFRFRTLEPALRHLLGRS